MRNIAKKSNTLDILNKYHLTAAKKYGQNFLVDPHIIEKIASCAPITKDTYVIEIGPGIGALTEALALRAKKVICFEIDERLKPVLADTLADYDNVEIIFEDFMKADLDGLVTSLHSDDVCVVTNLPYYITSDIITKVVTAQSQIHHMAAMVQKEVALKLTRDKSPLTLMIDYVGSIDYAMTVSKNVFIPAPHVDSAVFTITKERTIPLDLCELIKGAFKQKRKTILNNMKPFFNDPRKALAACGIDPTKRPADLSIEDYVALNQERRNHES